MPTEHPLIHVLHPGLFTTVQDLGRSGFQRFGVSVSGAMDLWALTVGNRLLGNPDRSAGLEITLHGPELLFEHAQTIAITGAHLSPTSNGLAIPMWTVVAMQAGSRLQFGMRQEGARAYLTVAGGIAGPMILGSLSTHVRSGLGGQAGRPVKKWDQLRAGPVKRSLAQLIGRSLPERYRPRYERSPTVRVMAGPQYDSFTDEALRLFTSTPYRVTTESDRMGYRLKGVEIPHRASTEIVSEAVCAGSLQVPPNRQPILLMADCQPTGGYAKLATMISADRSLAAQLAPGDSLSFRMITAQKASELFRSNRAELDRILPPCRT